MTPDLARERLMAQTAEFDRLLENNDYIHDWHGSPKTFANTGYAKGERLKPKLDYIDGPEREE